MKYSNEKPPVYNICHERFGANWDKGVVFAYGDTIYTKYPENVTKDVEVHEEVHMRQQEAIGKDIWWQRYFDDPDFRMKQEREAYRVQLRYARDHYNRGCRKALFKHVCKSFSSLSGGTITEAQAEEILK